MTGGYNTAPSCVGCDHQMNGEAGWHGIWFLRVKEATPFRGEMEAPAIVYFCPQCEWRVQEFTRNHRTVDVARFEGTSPDEVLRWAMGGAWGDDD